ncbi:hypothetical protein [Enterococcus hirae]|uniref:hypothetical protein n=1 Tax=Enterococcus hirae TaxID=1354 RepID=UPI003AAC294D
MKYKNTKTGVTFSSSCVISGGDWVLVEDNKKTEQSKREMEKQEKQEKQDPLEDKVREVAEKQVEEDKTGDPAFDSITVPQIKQELDAFGIKYSATAKKQELYDLMMSQGK